jgi:1,4-dihydroxy-2-naphthoyl-CoA hydrolase
VTAADPTQADAVVGTGEPAEFNDLLGIELDRVSADEMRGSLAVRRAIQQPAGIVHGGVYASVAETLASVGTLEGVRESGHTAVGLSNQTSFVRPISAGRIQAHARPQHRGRTTWVWDVEMRDDRDRLCALARVTIAVRVKGAGVP